MRLVLGLLCLANVSLLAQGQEGPQELRNTARDAYDRVGVILKEMRSIAQEAIDGNSCTTRAALQERMDQQIAQIDHLADEAVFAGRKVLQGWVWSRAEKGPSPLRIADLGLRIGRTRHRGPQIRNAQSHSTSQAANRSA